MDVDVELPHDMGSAVELDSIHNKVAENTYTAMNFPMNDEMKQFSFQEDLLASGG